MNDWLSAFLVTQLVEIPLYLWAARGLRLPARAAYAAGASTITHPVIWFCLPWQTGPYVPLVIAAECFAIIVEGLWGRAWRLRRPWRAALLANISSVCVGFALRAL